MISNYLLCFSNNYYGTSKQSIKNLQDQKKIGLLDIDMTGVASIQNSGFPAKFVFIEPPSFEEVCHIHFSLFILIIS